MSAPTVDRSQRGEQARAARQEEILDAARVVFAERGFKGTTIADVAEAAGIALGTIYLYFRSKEDIFAALSQRLHNLIADCFAPGEGREPTLDATVRLRVRRVFTACAENRDLVRLVVLNIDPGSAAARRMRDAEPGRAEPLVEGLRYTSAQGWTRKEDPCVMAKLITGLVSMAVYQAYVFGDGRDADQLREACADMIVAYLRPDSETAAGA